jgi:flagellar motor switch protein FliM
MDKSDLLSQEEIDALLHGVDSGEVATGAGFGAQDGIAREYDFNGDHRIVRGRMPGLDVINQRFARHLRTGLFGLLRRSAEVSVGGVTMSTFSDYVHALSPHTSLNTVKVKPLRGTALFVLDPKLVFILVENFFGGDGRYQARIEGREFTPTEQRVVRMTVEHAFTELKKSWAPVAELDFEYLKSEVNPQFANIVAPGEMLVISTFHIELDGGGGDLHVTLPYAMIEPMRAQLAGGVQGDRREVDERWSQALSEELKGAEVGISATLTEASVRLADVLNFRAGDIIPVDLPEDVLVCAEGIPVLRGRFGVSEGYNAIKVTGRIRRAD